MATARRNFPKSLDDAEIQTFCPTRIGFGIHVFDGLLDRFVGGYGGFFVLNEDLPIEHCGANYAAIIRQADVAEVVFHQLGKEMSIPCRIQEYWVDDDGLLAYLRVKFPGENDPSRQQLDHWMATRW